MNRESFSVRELLHDFHNVLMRDWHDSVGSMSCLFLNRHRSSAVGTSREFEVARHFSLFAIDLAYQGK